MYPRGDVWCQVASVRLTETVQTGGLTPHCCMMYTQSSPVDTLNIVKAALPAATHAEAAIAIHAKATHPNSTLSMQHTHIQPTHIQPYQCKTPKFNLINCS